jgi:hypothetical protein
MLTFNDEKRLRNIVKEEVTPIAKTVEKTAINVDKILKMFVRLDQEHTLTQAKVNKHDKRLRKVEKILKIPSPSESVIFT